MQVSFLSPLSFPAGDTSPWMYGVVVLPAIGRRPQVVHTYSIHWYIHQIMKKMIIYENNVHSVINMTFRLHSHVP